MLFINKDETSQGAIIKVIGLGGGGGNAVNTMAEEGIKGVELIAANTDKQALRMNSVHNKIQIGKKLTNGLGAGGDPKVGKDAAIEDYELIKHSIKDADMLFITAGMGGGTGTGAAPIVAEIAKNLKILTVGVVTKPFKIELEKKNRIAEDGIKELKKYVDTLIVVSNDKIFEAVNNNLPIKDSFKFVDKILLQGIEGITGIINEPGYMNIDFADIRTVMRGKGLAIMGLGHGRGDDRALNAVQDAVNSPLLDNISIEGAKGLVVNITSGPNLSQREFSDAIKFVSDLVSKNAEVKAGFVIDQRMNDDAKVTIIATGFSEVETRIDVKTPLVDIDLFSPKDYDDNEDYDTPSILRKNYTK